MDVTHDNWKVIQLGDPECANSISIKSDSAAVFNKLYKDPTEFANVNTFFTNSKSGKCPILSCTLHASDCQTDLASDTKLTIGTTSPFAIMAETTVEAGHDTGETCLKCTNGVQTATKAGWKVIQAEALSGTCRSTKKCDGNGSCAGQCPTNEEISGICEESKCCGVRGFINGVG